LQAEAEALRAERDSLRARLAEADDARAKADSVRTELDALRAQLADAERTRAEAAALRAERAYLRERLDNADAARAEADAVRAERDALRDALARAEATGSARQSEEAEPLRRAAETAEVRARKAEEELAAAQRDLAIARSRAGLQDEERRRRLEEAEARARAIGQQWDEARRSLRAAAAAVRRAAFLPPAVRVSVQEAVGSEDAPGRKPPWLGTVLLDRDALALETVAEALETAGVAVHTAGHPEEIALLLRTAGASQLKAVVCDVMAFRPDQNVAGLIRTWDKERPGLAYFLSFDTESASEVERARRIPTSIIAGHVPRPLAALRLLESLEALAKRRGRAPA
jgi:hypothetical protein